MDQTSLRKTNRHNYRLEAKANKAQNGQHRKGRLSNKQALPTLFACVCIAIFFLSIPVTVAAAATLAGDVDLNNFQSVSLLSRQDPNCTIIGSSDAYGLGIRVGLYAQWIGSSIAYILVPTEAIPLRGINNCFQASMLAGLIALTVAKGTVLQGSTELYAIEAYIMLTLSIGGVWIGNMYVKHAERKNRPWRKYFASFDATDMGGTIRLFLGATFFGYGVWFTFYGMDTMARTPCPTYAFFFLKVDLYGPYRTFLKVAFTVGTILCTFAVLVGLCSFNWKCDGGGEEDEYEILKGTNNICGIGLIIFVIAVELMIKWNNITQVHFLGKTGQLLPMIIGILGVSRVFHGLMEDLCENYFSTQKHAQIRQPEEGK